MSERTYELITVHTYASMTGMPPEEVRRRVRHEGCLLEQRDMIALPARRPPESKEPNDERA